jgi:glycosyltransferase involved in cell wall biosynthesis
MKVVYIHQYFNTPTEGGSLRSYYLAKALIDKDFEVEMITTWNQKHYEKKDIEGITVHYLPVFYDNDLGFFGRIRAFLAFAWRSFFFIRKIPNIQLIYATSTPLTVGFVALLLKYLYNIPYYFEVRDLWPLAPIQMGYLKNKVFQKILFGLERKIYQNAEKIIALSPAMVSYVEVTLEKVPKKNKIPPIFLIPNMADCEETPFALASGFPTFQITYAGTLGEANHLEYFLEIAKFFQAKNNTSVNFQIVGKGKELEFLKQKSTDYQLLNLTFLPFSATEKVREILYASQAIYISFLNKPIFETNSPNKFFEGLAAGKLIITNTKGWLKELIEENQCGFYADPENPADFYQQLQPFLQNSQLLETFQKNARQLAESQFDRKMLCERFVQCFDDLSEKK